MYGATDGMTTVGSSSGQQNLQKLIAFAQGRCSPSYKPRCVELALYHHTDAGSGVLLTTTVSEKLDGEVLETKVTEIVQELFNSAMSNVETHQRPQRYGIGCFGKAGLPIGRFDFLLYPPPSLIVGGETEPASATGMLAMSMRFAETTMRQNAMSSQVLLERYGEEIQRLRAENDTLRQRHLEVMTLKETLLDKHAERDRLIREEDESARRMQKVFTMLESIAVNVIEKHGPIQPLQNTIQKLRPDQIIQMMGALEPEQMQEFSLFIPPGKLEEAKAYAIATQQAAQAAEGKSPTS